MLINNTSISVVEYRGQRVVTLAMIDKAHARPVGTAGRNFRKNRQHFIQGTDFFQICDDEIRRHKIIEISPKHREDVQLFTETGYLMIAKSLTDDLSWKVQRELVNVYFSMKSRLIDAEREIHLRDQAYFKKYPLDSTIRSMAMRAEPYWYIGTVVHRAAGTVGKAVRRMIEWRVMDEHRLKIARIGAQPWWAHRRKHYRQLPLFS